MPTTISRRMRSKPRRALLACLWLLTLVAAVSLVSFTGSAVERVLTPDYAVLTDYTYKGEESDIRYEFQVERTGEVHRVLMCTYYQGEPRVKDLPVFTEPQDVSGKYVEIADAILLSDGAAAVLIAERYRLFSLVADRLCGVIELIQLTGAGSVSGAKVIEHKGLIYVAYAALPGNHWRNKEFIYTQIRYRVRTYPGRWTKERILYSSPDPFNYPVHLQWIQSDEGLSLSAHAERFENAPDLEVTLSVLDEEPGA